MNLNFAYYRNFRAPIRYDRCLILLHMFEADVFGRFLVKVYGYDIALSACVWLETLKVPRFQLESDQLRIIELYCSDIGDAIDFITLGIFRFLVVHSSYCLAVFVLIGPRSSAPAHGCKVVVFSTLGARSSICRTALSLLRVVCFSTVPAFLCGGLVSFVCWLKPETISFAACTRFSLARLINGLHLFCFGAFFHDFHLFGGAFRCAANLVCFLQR